MLLLLGIPAFSQKLKTDGKLTIRLRAGGNAAYVYDKDVRSSAEYFPADGATSKHDESNSFVTFGANYDFGKGKLLFSPGLWFTAANISLFNHDGGLVPENRYDSRYDMSYLQIPLLIKYQSTKELTKNLTWYVSGGPQIGFKLRESLYTKDGYGDYAHFWNMAKQIRYNNDARAQNGNYKTMSLINPIYASFMINGGVDYKLNDKISLIGGLTFDFGLTNVLNPKIEFLDRYNHDGPRYPQNTYPQKLTDLLTVRHNFIGIDLGVRF